MQNLGKLTNHHLIISDEEQLALVNALAFFHEFFSDGLCDLKEWHEIARDQRIELFDQLARKIATL